MDAGLVTIKIFDNIAQSSLVQSFLSSEGIDSFVQDEHMGQLFGVANLFGIRLQVRSVDAQRAIALLIQGGFASAEDYR